MNLYEILILIIIGLSAGILAGVMGVGGAIIIIPALVYFFHLTQHQAQGTSLAILLFPVGILAFINYYRQGYVDFKIAVIIMLAFVVGGYFGSLIAIHSPAKILRILFGVLLVFTGIRMIWGK